MLREEIAWVRAEIAEAIAKIPPPVTPKPVEVDIDGIVKLVLDKIKVTSSEATEIPIKKGKEK